MSNTIAHLVVANRILQEWPLLIQNIDAFYLGSVAPDTIGSKAGCSREDKKRVHLRDGIRDAEWLTDEKMQLFKERVQCFIDEHISNMSGVQHDFNVGYLVHLLTDEWNHRTIRQTMLRIANKRDVLESDREFFYMMTNDLEALDNHLLRSNEEIAEVLSRMLHQEVSCALPGYIESSYIDGSIQWWKNAYLPNICERELKYISEGDIARFVDLATKEIINELSALLK